MTYNGVNGTTTLTINQATNTSLSFSIRTRQESASILSMDNGEFQIVIEDKKLVFTTKSGNQKFEGKMLSIFSIANLKLPPTIEALKIGFQPEMLPIE